MNLAPADHIYANGRIRTMEPGGPAQIEALAVRDGRIVATGTTRDVMTLQGRDTSVTGLDGATVLPGFIETHMHPLTFGVQEQQLVIGDDIHSIDQLIGLIATTAAELPTGTEILAWRFDHAAVSGGRHLTAHDLDAATTSHPVLVRNVSGHLVYVNTVVLEAHGIGPGTPDPPGGEIVRDPSGRPTGQFNEPAGMDLVTPILPTLDAAGNRRALAITQQTLLAAGVTSVHDCGVWSEQHLAAYVDALARDEFLPRTRLYAYTPDLDLLPTWTGGADPASVFGGIKFAVDGMLLGETARLRSPYEGVGGSGALLEEPDDLDRAVAEAHDRGFQVAIHAEGDAGLDIALDAIEGALRSSPRRDHRHRVEHVELVNADQIERMQRLEVAASMLLNGVNRWGDHLLDVLGPQRGEAVSPLKSLIAAGVPTALHSDCPITPASPLASISTAVTRKSRSGSVVGASEAVGIHDAIRAVTSVASHLGFEDGDRGSLEVGKLADLITLSADPYETDPLDIPNIQVQQTVIGGEPVWTS